MENVYIVAIAIGAIAVIALAVLNRDRLARFGFKIPGMSLSMVNKPDEPKVPAGTRVSQNEMTKSQIRTPAGESTEVTRNKMRDSSIDVG